MYTKESICRGEVGSHKVLWCDKRRNEQTYEKGFHIKGSSPMEIKSNQSKQEMWPVWRGKQWINSSGSSAFTWVLLPTPPGVGGWCGGCLLTYLNPCGGWYLLPPTTELQCLSWVSADHTGKTQTQLCMLCVSFVCVYFCLMVTYLCSIQNGTCKGSTDSSNWTDAY